MTDDPGREGPLRVVVVGAGAVGSFLGGTLAAAGADVTLLTRRRQGHPEATAMRIHEPGGERTVAVRWAADPDGLEPPDLAILAVKAFDLDG